MIMFKVCKLRKEICRVREQIYPSRIACTYSSFNRMERFHSPLPPGATPGDRENLPSRLKKEASSSSERRRGREVGWILLINVELELPDAPQEEAEGESEKARN